MEKHLDTFKNRSSYCDGTPASICDTWEGNISELRTVILANPAFIKTNSYLVFNTPELPRPACVVEERPVVKALVRWTVAFSVVGRRHGGHLVAVD